MFGSRLEVRRFDDEIAKYLERPVETGKILFYGDSFFTRSSFTYCDRHPEKGHPLFEETLLAKDGSKAVINHGFGTSSADDLLYYYDRLVRPYAPRALIISTGSNDIGFGYSPAESMNVTATLIDWFQAEFPDAPVYVFKKMPGIKNKGTVNHVTRFRQEYNEYLEDYCARKEGVQIVDLYQAPFYFEKPEDIGDPEMVREDIYDTDRVHFNKMGYEMFIDYLRDLLQKEGLLG